VIVAAFLDEARHAEQGLPAAQLEATGPGRLTDADGRELSAIKNVARSTTTGTPHRGHLGVIGLPVTPSR
jgi:hypothetical protein